MSSQITWKAARARMCIMRKCITSVLKCAYALQVHYHAHVYYMCITMRMCIATSVMCIIRFMCIQRGVSGTGWGEAKEPVRLQLSERA